MEEVGAVGNMSSRSDKQTQIEFRYFRLVGVTVQDESMPSDGTVPFLSSSGQEFMEQSVSV